MSKLASPGCIDEKTSPEFNYLLTINDSECEIKETLNSNNNNNNNNIIINNYNNKNQTTLNKINTLELKTKPRKSITLERKLNNCNSLSTKNTNFAKNKNENINSDFKSQMLNNILGNLIISKKHPGSLTEQQQTNSNKNPFNNLITKTKTQDKINNSKLNCEYNSLVKDDSQITEIVNEENASINNLEACEGKTRNNALVLSPHVSKSFINDCNDLDESASLINFNNNINNNHNYANANISNNNNSVVVSFSESGRKSRFGNSFNKQLKFSLLLKMHDYSNANLVKINELESKQGEEDFGNDKSSAENKELNLNGFVNENMKNESKKKSESDLNHKEKKEVFCSFANESININNSIINNNENLLKQYFSNLHLNELKPYKENMKLINKNISRLNTDKSPSSKNTSNNNFYKNTNKSYLLFKEKRKFMSNSFMNILTFLNGKEIKSLYYAFKQMRLLIIDSLMMEVNRKLLNIFKMNCGHMLDLLSKKLSFKKSKSKKKNILFYIFYF